MHYECPHNEFAANVDVVRLTDEGGVVVGYSVDVTCECAGCHQPFVFHAPVVGLLSGTPTRDVSGQKLSAPGRVATQPDDFGLQLPGLTLQPMSDN